MTTLTAIFTVIKPASDSKVGISFDTSLKIVDVKGISSKCGFLQGDIILEVNDKAVSTNDECLEMIQSGTTLAFKISRPTDGGSYDVVKLIKSDPAQKTGISMDDTGSGFVSIVKVVPGGLASNAGLKAGDTVVGIGDVLLTGGSDQCLELIKGSSREVLVTIGRCTGNLFQSSVKEEFGRTYNIRFQSPRIAIMDHKDNNACMSCCMPGCVADYSFKLTLRTNGYDIFVEDILEGSFTRTANMPDHMRNQINEKKIGVIQRAAFIQNKLVLNQRTAPQPMAIAERVDIKKEESTDDVATQLTKLKGLLDGDVISEEEFLVAKAKVLG